MRSQRPTLRWPAVQAGKAVPPLAATEASRAQLSLFAAARWRAQAAVLDLTSAVCSVAWRQRQTVHGGAAASAASSDLGLINPATISAGIASLPFIAQTAAGGIVAALGGALAGVGIADGRRAVSSPSNAWASPGRLLSTLQSIGQAPFLFPDANPQHGWHCPRPERQCSLCHAMGQCCRSVWSPSPPPLGTFTQPEVALSIHAVATAFGTARGTHAISWAM